MNDGISIIIPCMDRANFLAVTLDGLSKYSETPLHIIVVNSDPADTPAADNSDYFINAATGEKDSKYEHITDLLKARTYPNLRITYVDATKDVQEFRMQLVAGMAHPENRDPFGGSDIAFKNNLGLAYVDTPWVIPNWDDDFYPDLHWDLHLLDVAAQYKRNTVFIPRHVQAFTSAQIDSMEANGQTAFYGQPWFEMTLPGYVTAAQWAEYCNLHTHDKIVEETPGERTACHYLPMMYRTDEFLKTIGPYCYKGSGYELEMDDRCRELGFVKVSTHRSFILHKGYIPKVKVEL